MTISKHKKRTPAKGRIKKPEKFRRFTQAGIQRGMKHSYVQLHGQYTGYHSAVVQRMLKAPVKDRKSQFLTHLATGIKAWYGEVSNSSEIEVQIALHDDDCFIISSNDNGTADYIYKKLVRKTAIAFLNDVAAEASARASRSVANDAHRIARHAGKLEKELTGVRRVSVAAMDSFEQDGRDITASFDAGDDIGASFADFLNRSGAMADKFVAIITHTGMEAHAEQKILIALCKAAPFLDRDAPILVAGTFRPCRGCFESLSVAKRYCFPNLQFGVRPGHYWRTTQRAHTDIVKLIKDGGYISARQSLDDFDDEGLLIGLTNTTHRPVLWGADGNEADDLHYGTDSDSEDEDVDNDD